MKTTVEISDALLRAAKRMAAERNMTLRTIIEAALRRHLEATADEAHTRPGLSESDWATIRERAYESRGG